MLAYHDAGFTTWDLADHYGPAEDFIGEFRRALAADRGEEALAQVQAFTKWVPPPGRMTRQIVEENIDVSLRRMGVDTPRPAAVPLVGVRATPATWTRWRYLAELRTRARSATWP